MSLRPVVSSPVSSPFSFGYPLLLVMALMAAPGLATGQGMPGGMGSGRGGGRRHGGGSPSRGDADQRRVVADSMMERRGFAAFVLDHAQALVLTAAQRVTLDSINTAFHVGADTLRPQLDSLRTQNARAIAALTAPGVPRTAGDSLSTTQRDSLVRRRHLIGTLLTSLGTLEQDTRTRSLALLTVEQRQQIATFEQIQRGGGGPRSGGSPDGTSRPDHRRE